MIQRKRFGTKIFLYLGLAIVALYIFIPLVWVFTTSLKTTQDVFHSPVHYIPKPITFKAYTSLFANLFRIGESSYEPVGGFRLDFRKYFMNSITITLAASSIGLFLSAFAAYGFSRYSFKGRTLMGLSLIVTQLIPVIMFIFPIYLMYIKLNLLNKNIGLIFQYIAGSLPFAIWLLRGYFARIPYELEESAMIDGCSRLGIVFKIVFPLAKPALMVIWMVQILGCWKEFLAPYILNLENETITVALYKLIQGWAVPWSQVSAVVVMATIPVIIFFLFLQRYYTKGIITGALKF